MGQEEERRLHLSSLRGLGASDLSRYARKAMTTWGGVDDFRHFLPRLFELAAHDALGFDIEIDIEILFGKLRCANWEAWPDKEQAAVRKYLHALWSATLRGEIEPHQVEDLLCCLACATDEIEPILEAWVEPPDSYRLQLLASWLLSGEALGNVFWHPEARSRARAWLLDAHISERLEACFFAGDDAMQDATSRALDGIGLLRQAPLRRGRPQR